MLHCLVYTSVATHDLDNDEIMQLLDAARRKNERLDVTGLLLYYKRSFMQVLEGKHEVIRELFHDQIALDDRHLCVEVRAEYEIDERKFSGWRMAFRNLDDFEPSQLEAYSTFLEHGFTSDVTVDKDDVAQRLLLTMKDIW